MNVRVLTDPLDEDLWISPALPGRTHDLTAARIPASSESASARASRSSQTAPTRTPAPGSPPDSNGHRLVNSPSPGAPSTGALATARASVERGMARLKSWQNFRRSRIRPNRMTGITKAVLTLERQR
ncbi:hypothetical protein OG567_41245 [Streptomyces zaomyceticus]